MPCLSTTDCHVTARRLKHKIVFFENAPLKGAFFLVSPGCQKRNVQQFAGWTYNYKTGLLQKEEKIVERRIITADPVAGM